jgi:hypothetical protein
MKAALCFHWIQRSQLPGVESLLASRNRFGIIAGEGLPTAELEGVSLLWQRKS